MRTRRTLFACVSAVVVLAACPAATKAAAPQSEAALAPDIAQRLFRIENVVEENREKLGVPGAALVVVKDDRVLLAKGFGVKDLDSRAPVGAGTLFSIGSVTKSFTAMLAVMAADEGRLSLEDSPKKYLPYFQLLDAEADANITLRDLLDHASGLPRSDLGLFLEGLTREDLIRMAARIKPTARLREKFQYQNIMYTAAGEAVARAFGSTWEAVIAEHVLRPLHMDATITSFAQLKQAPDVAAGHALAADKASPAPRLDLTAAAPAGALASNAGDMAQWLRLMLGGGAIDGVRLVSAKGFAEISTPQMKFGSGGYGLGWFIEQREGLTLIHHGGNVPGFETLVVLIPQRNLGFALLTNVSRSGLPALALRAVLANLAEPAAVAHSSAPASAGAAPDRPDGRELLGTYRMPGASVEIRIRDGKLVAVVLGQPPYTLIAAGKDRFRLAELTGYGLTVSRGADRKVTGIVMNQPNGSFALARAGAAAKPMPADRDVEDVMARALAAVGGEANLRRHRTMKVVTSMVMESQGLTVDTVLTAQAPDLRAYVATFGAGDKTVGRALVYCHGVNGRTGSDATDLHDAPGACLSDVDYQAQLNWKTWFRSVTVTGKTVLDGEEVYVVRKVVDEKQREIDYISATSFLVLRRVVLGGDGGTVTTRYRDYRAFDGVMVPMSIVVETAATGRMVGEVKEVAFDVAVPEMHASAAEVAAPRQP